MRLIELARDDYLAGRFHACVPLLLALLDGLVNDISRHVGFFAQGVNLTAWDSIAAHETGLAALAKIMGQSRTKTNEDSINIPFRNGILHGRELAFDNHVVAAKCWAALFAVGDWAGALADGKAKAKPKEKISWRQFFHQIAETGRLKRAVEAWRPRQPTDLAHLPHSGQLTALPEGTPERAVAEFLDNWCKRRFGLLADALLDFTSTSKGAKAGRAKEDFGRCVPTAFRITNVADEAAAVSHVAADLVFQTAQGITTVRVNVRTVYIGADNRPTARGQTSGSWRIVQNSFSEVIYAPSATPGATDQ